MVQVYRRTNSVENKVYIDQGPERRRWVEQRFESRRGRGYLLGEAIRKYGEASFNHEILYVAKDKIEAERMETFFIILHQSHIPEFGYNVTLGGRGRGKGRVAASRYQKHLETLRNRYVKMPKEERIRRTAAMRAAVPRVRSTEHKRKHRESLIRFYQLKKEGIN